MEKDLMDRILNSETVTREEMIQVYGKEYIEEIDKQYQESYVYLTPEEEEILYQETFKKEIAIDKEIKELKRNKDNQILEIVQNLQNKNSMQEPKKDIDSNLIYDNFDEYYNKYIEHKKTFNKVSKASITSYKSTINYLKYFTNKDTIFNFAFFKELQKNLQQLPTNFFKYPKYKGITFKKVVELKKKDKYNTLNTKTVNKHITNLKLFFEYLAYEEIIESNPLQNIRQLMENKDTRKIEYTKQELEQIFTSNLEIDYLNMCKVALYSGLRIEEVLSLKKEDIKDNILNVDIKDKGTKKHQRSIPLHKNLIDTINQQLKNKGNYLFFNGNIENEVGNIGKKLNRRLQKIINNKDKTFHSLRKNFSQELELNTDSEDKIKKYLMGHTFSKDVTHMIYNRGKINQEKLIDCINQITFIY